MFPIAGINIYRTKLITLLHVQGILHAKYYLLFTF